MSGATSTDDDDRFMGLALALGRRHLGQTWPNPSVGAVVVAPDAGVILAQATTAPGGRPHGEPLALAAAGEAVRGAILYVGLEPCSHHGRTPPCAHAIVAAGIGRVVSAMADPDPRVAGRGHALLRAAGITVTTDIRATEAGRDHAGHVSRVRLGRPHLTLKLAETANGVAATSGPRLLISGEAANARTHLLRTRADAVLVGIGTAEADDPRLDVRLPGLEDRRPVRIVLDTTIRLPPDSRLAGSAHTHPTWVVAGPDASAAAESRLSDRGVRVLRAAIGADGRLDLGAALRALAAAGLTRIFCEGGPALAEAFAAADLVDAFVRLTSPRAQGGPGIPALGPHLSRALAGPLALREETRAGGDRIRFYERALPCSPGS